jgi:hypothetical protein
VLNLEVLPGKGNRGQNDHKNAAQTVKIKVNGYFAGFLSQKRS